jgi:hypothetical protein
MMDDSKPSSHERQFSWRLSLTLVSLALTGCGRVIPDGHTPTLALDDATPGTARSSATTAGGGVVSRADTHDADARFDCGSSNLLEYHEDESDHPDPAPLVRAANCFYDAGAFAHASRILSVLQEKHPEVGSGLDFEDASRRAMDAIVDADWAKTLPCGRRCSSIQGSEGLTSAETRRLVDAAECYRECGYVAAQLEVYTEVVLRPDLDDKVRRFIEAEMGPLERTIEKATERQKTSK